MMRIKMQKGSRADKAGVFVGDEVLEINGVLVDAGFPAEALNDLFDSRHVFRMADADRFIVALTRNSHTF